MLDQIRGIVIFDEDEFDIASREIRVECDRIADVMQDIDDMGE